MRRFMQLKEMNWKSRGTLSEATVFLGAARLMIKLLPFRTVRKLTGKPERHDTREQSPVQTERIRQIGKIIEMASRHLPWECKCLAQAMAGKYMLAWRGIPSTIYIGVARDEQGLASHAWLKSGILWVTGEKGSENFTVITDLTENPG